MKIRDLIQGWRESKLPDDREVVIQTGKTWRDIESITVEEGRLVIHTK
jgi:hypothetical protein